MSSVEQYMEKLKGTLKEKRFIHSLGTMETAVKLAEIFGVDVEKARVAGLLHDCAKNYAMDTQYALCESMGIELDLISKNSPKVVHQFLGAELIRMEYGIRDEEIIEAVRCHTTAKTGMSNLDKVLYLADFTEPNRDFNGLEELRDLSYKNLDDAMLFALEIEIKKRIKKGQVLHPDTVNCRNQLILDKLGVNP